VRVAVGSILVVAGVLTALFGGFTMVYAGDAPGGEPAVGQGVAIAAVGLGSMALGIWIVSRSRRS
jgi:hypothetical protein